MIFTVLLRFLYWFNVHLGRDPCFEKRWLNQTGYFFRIRNDDVDIFWHCLGFLLFWWFHNQIFLNNCWFYGRRKVLLSVTASGGFRGRMGGCIPPTSLNITCIWIIFTLFKKSNQWIVVMQLVWLWYNFKSRGEEGCKKVVFVQRSFYKTEINLLQVRLIWRRQISKTHSLYFSALKA